MSTLGNPLVDYIVADPVALPRHVSQHMSGRVMHMPLSFFPNSHPLLFPVGKPLFGINPALDKSRAQLRLPYRAPPSQGGGGGWEATWESGESSDAAFVFCTFNKHLKIHSESATAASSGKAAAQRGGC